MTKVKVVYPIEGNLTATYEGEVEEVRNGHVFLKGDDGPYCLQRGTLYCDPDPNAPRLDPASLALCRTLDPSFKEDPDAPAFMDD